MWPRKMKSLHKNAQVSNAGGAFEKLFVKIDAKSGAETLVLAG